MSDLVFNPGGGLVSLPMSVAKARVREFFGGDHQAFMRSSGDTSSDYWPSLGVFAYYSADDKLEALEFAGPVTPTFFEATLNNLSRKEAVAKLLDFDPNTLVEDDGAISKAAGLSVWSATKNPDEPISSTVTFRAGYYD
ncbi:hypothetical protein [Novosphingobium huizhouense]|uniref:hypothetical protein n=1 Tax=Novosphingobium huizhouense TaxID=2866625 RepID=UPI001CD88BDD|nr:hypothetical protein [Novosphingobium huizhouense]